MCRAGIFVPRVLQADVGSDLLLCRSCSSSTSAGSPGTHGIMESQNCLGCLAKRPRRKRENIRSLWGKNLEGNLSPSLKLPALQGRTRLWPIPLDLPSILGREQSRDGRRKTLPGSAGCHLGSFSVPLLGHSSVPRAAPDADPNLDTHSGFWGGSLCWVCPHPLTTVGAGSPWGPGHQSPCLAVLLWLVCVQLSLV